MCHFCLEEVDETRDSIPKLRFLEKELEPFLNEHCSDDELRAINNREDCLCQDECVCDAPLTLVQVQLESFWSYDGAADKMYVHRFDQRMYLSKANASGLNLNSRAMFDLVTESLRDLSMMCSSSKNDKNNIDFMCVSDEKDELQDSIHITKQRLSARRIQKDSELERERLQGPLCSCSTLRLHPTLHWLPVCTPVLISRLASKTYEVTGFGPKLLWNHISHWYLE